MSELLNNYEIIKIKINNEKVKCAKVGDYIAVARYSDGYSIYRFIDSKRLFPIKFRNIDDALLFASWISDLYEEYLALWQAYPRADVFNWARLTVPNGEGFYELTQYLKQKEREITLKEIKEIYAKALQ